MRLKDAVPSVPNKATKSEPLMVHLKNNYPLRIGLLILLYTSQGLPFGFQATALPVYLRTMGVSLTSIGFVGALSLPWLLKAFWAPLVDRLSSARFGRRKSWIIPLQIMLVAVIYTASKINPTYNLSLLLILVLVMNFLASLQDIAVDGLTIDILADKELGPGNIAQVAGYKTGMILTGGLLLWLCAGKGWNIYFMVMASIAFLPLPLLFIFKENEGTRGTTASMISIKIIILSTVNRICEPGSVLFIIFIATYKLGECLIDPMFKPFLVDRGFHPQDIGLWVGTWGMAASLTGSIAGGLLCTRVNLRKALIYSLFFRLIPVGCEAILTFISLNEAEVIAVTIAEHLFGGMLTTVLFAFMMSTVNKDAAATHYTVLASIEVFGKMPGVWLSGLIADRIGYSGDFLIGFILSIVVIPLVIMIPEHHFRKNSD